MESIPLLQQYLPFTVLKLSIDIIGFLRCWCVTTVLTVYGIETLIERNKIFKESYNSTYRLRYWNKNIRFERNEKREDVTTVLTVYGIETPPKIFLRIWPSFVTTVLTVYGIETQEHNVLGECQPRSLQQYLPFTVLKHNRNFDIRKPLRLWCYNSTYRLRYWNSNASFAGSVNLSTTLQQYLPFTVLKPTAKVLGIKLKSQLQQYLPFTVLKQSYFRASNAHLSGYNSTYRLRYWNVLTRIIEQREKIVTTVLTVYGIETFR